MAEQRTVEWLVPTVTDIRWVADIVPIRVAGPGSDDLMVLNDVTVDLLQWRVTTPNRGTNPPQRHLSASALPNYGIYPPTVSSTAPAHTDRRLLEDQARASMEVLTHAQQSVRYRELYQAGMRLDEAKRLISRHDTSDDDVVRAWQYRILHAWGHRV